MFKKSFKYILIALANFIILIMLLRIWTDRFELLFNDLVRLNEFLKIVGVTILSLIGMRLLIPFFRKRNIKDIRSKIRIAALTTILISSYLYASYSIKIVRNRFINGDFRNNITSKVGYMNTIISGTTSANTVEGTMADELTIIEYQEISKMTRFIDISTEASNISYEYEHDDAFLPDYQFLLTYDLPKDIKMDTFHFQKGDFYKSQEICITGNIQKVTYLELKQ